MPRYSDNRLVFGVHFTFPVLAGRELFTQPLMTNNNQPDLISFNQFSKFQPMRFDPNSPKELESYFALDQNGYTYHNQYPGIRQDISEAEGNHRFSLGVEYPWYQRFIKQLIGGIQYEYMDLTHFLLKCARGFVELDAIMNDTNAETTKRIAAAAKGKALYILYSQVTKEFKVAYPQYKIITRYKEGTSEVVDFDYVLEEKPVTTE